MLSFMAIRYGLKLAYSMAVPDAIAVGALDSGQPPIAVQHTIEQPSHFETMVVAPLNDSFRKQPHGNSAGREPVQLCRAQHSLGGKDRARRKLKCVNDRPQIFHF